SVNRPAGGRDVIRTSVASVTSVAGPIRASTGDTVTVTFTLPNGGSKKSNNVHLGPSIAGTSTATAQFVSATSPAAGAACSASGCDFGTLESGATVTATFTYLVPSSSTGGYLDIDANAMSDSMGDGGPEEVIWSTWLTTALTSGGE